MNTGTKIAKDPIQLGSKVYLPKIGYGIVVRITGTTISVRTDATSLYHCLEEEIEIL